MAGSTSDTRDRSLSIYVLTPTAAVGAVQLLHIVVVIVVAATHGIPFVGGRALGHTNVEFVGIDHRRGTW